MRRRKRLVKELDDYLSVMFEGLTKLADEGNLTYFGEGAASVCQDVEKILRRFG